MCQFRTLGGIDKPYISFDTCPSFKVNVISATMFVWFETWWAGMRPGKSTGSGPSTSGSDKEDGLP